MDTKIRDTINKKMNQLEDYVDANAHVTSPSSHYTKDDKDHKNYFKSIN